MTTKIQPSFPSRPDNLPSRLPHLRHRLIDDLQTKPLDI